MNSITVLAIIVGFALLGYVIYKNVKQERQMTSEGKIINRSHRFIEQAEDFTIICDDPAIVSGKLESLPLSEMNVKMAFDGQHVFQFSFTHPSGNWTAVLHRIDAPAGQLAYSFNFTHWKVSDLGVIGELQMNMLLTAIEKMFLSIDPNTQVKTRLLETKTSHKFF